MPETYASLVGRHGTIRKAAMSIDMPYSTFHKYLTREKQDPVMLGIMDVEGTTLVPKNLWKRNVDADGNKYTVHFQPAGQEAEDIKDIIQNAIAESYSVKRPKFEARKKAAPGNKLLVVDLADVHFNKLCVKSETGYSYSMDVARHRVIEGVKALLAKAKHSGVGRILFVLGNDILHTDNAKGTTTSGTPQDTDGTPFEAYRVAKQASIEAIKLCAKVADVDLVHCMSNHDWLLGWTLSQSIAEHFSEHPNVNATEYNISEAHRKYYRYEDNLILVTHGDGAKEADLLALMLKEAGSHVSACPNRYVLQHHFHHKIAKRGKVTTEKDHIAMTSIQSGQGGNDEHRFNIEYVRSPSPPDGWHDRNGYVNRQAVECFLYDPSLGQDTRFTEWF